jgi:hypothetical protein
VKLEKISLLRFDTQYLAHPAELVDEGKVIQKKLEALGIKVLNPFDRQEDNPLEWWETPHSPEDAERVVERDLAWIRKSDAVFAYAPDTLKLCGTAMEIFYGAKMLGKPVFIYTSKKYRFHPWLMHFGQVFTDLPFALDVLKLRKKLEGYAFRIALGGKMGTGKSSMSDFMAKCFQFKRYSFASKLKQIARDLFDMEIKDRTLLQLLGTKVREMEQDAWANYVIKKINAEAPLRAVIDDMRYLNEASILHDNGFILLKLYSPVVARAKRGVAGFSAETAVHPSEVEIDAIDTDYNIDTSCDLDTCYRKVMEVLVEVAEK